MKKEYDLNKMKRRPGPNRMVPDADKTAISIRLDCIDLVGIKTEAYRLGIPYQTLIGSILHRFVTGELVDKSKVSPKKLKKTG